MIGLAEQAGQAFDRFMCSFVHCIVFNGDTPIRGTDFCLTFGVTVTKLGGGKWWQVVEQEIAGPIGPRPTPNRNFPVAADTPQFIGEYEDIPVDPKGRLIVPASFRRSLPMGVSTFVVARWLDGCLAAFEPQGWTSFIQRLQSQDRGQRQIRQMIRAMAGRATEVKIDGQGRVLIPRKHMEMAEITERATLVGVIDRVEIWNPDRYVGSLGDVNLEEIAEDLDCF
jgi:MraZ protein